jgi:cytochrome c551/c552
MPANESTWRDQKLMHVLFGVASLILLFGTLWMLRNDHDREWKRYQRKFRQVEEWSAENRIRQEETQEFEADDRELETLVAEAKSQVPDRQWIDQFKQVVEHSGVEVDLTEIDKAYDELAEEPSPDGRIKLIEELNNVQRETKRIELNAQRSLKFARAELDVVRSDYERGVGEGRNATELAALQEKVTKQQNLVNELADKYQDANSVRLELDAIIAKVTAHETEVAKQLDDHRADVVRLKKGVDEAELTIGEQLLALPIVDAFGRPLKVEQLWLPNLTINNNFRDIARFDRCITCHQGLEKTAAGSATIPAYPHTNRLTLPLATPETPPVTEAVALDETPKTEADHIREIYGIQFAEQGLEPWEVAISVVMPRSPASLAGLQAGDVIEQINDVRLDNESHALNQAEAYRYLLERVTWGQPLQILVRRGLPHPFSSHPRLDLFVGPMSPHKMADVGCTICHDGQGSSTSFEWSSHSPNTPEQREEWHEKYGWFENHHWIYPMPAKRFAESTCLKCHHGVTELMPSERFPDPPAPKLMKGYELIREYGCFGCHEINGFNGPTKRIGPDLRAEPNLFAAAQQLMADPNFSKLGPRARELADNVVAHPELTEDRRLLAEIVKEDSQRSGDEQPLLSRTSHKMGQMLNAEYETPGEFRKVGPSLRFVGSKVDFRFLYSWIKDPQNFRPTTKMPRFFGLYDHFPPVEKVDESGQVVTHEVVDAEGHSHEAPVMVESSGLAEAQRYEPVEIHAAAHFLLTSSQKFEYQQKPEGVTAEPSVDRGKGVFELRGCLACHQHKDFPEATATQGPNLSNIGSKLATPNGSQWLYSWVREPNRYHARTVMPNLFLETIKEADGSVTDPAADVTAYLLASQGWDSPEVPALNEENLNSLALQHLSGTFTKKQAEQYLQTGIPQELAGELKGDEIELVGPIDQHKKLMYVGRRTISKYGCSGCHDIPGFEDSKPIGTALADWGRKDPAKLAFEQIVQFVARTDATAERHETMEHDGSGHAHPEFHFDDMDPTHGYMLQQLTEHSRVGFLWQKLRAPRSFDYRKTENKTYNERLRMPKFPFNQEEIEAVMTFVLGLVAEAPSAPAYVFRGTPRQQALVAGGKVLEKYNCGGCHMLDLPTWSFNYDPSTFPEATKPEDYDFVLAHFFPDQLLASKKVDQRGLGQATVHGRPVMDDQGNPVEAEDDDGNPAYFFAPWRPVAINGGRWYPGGPDILIPQSKLTDRRGERGGDLARLLYPRVFAAEQAINPNAKSSDAWGWVPPPLVGEGRKVQTDWLHNFLLDPYPIRPAVVLRMPKFNMSSKEATQLVSYFAAKDDVPFPYVFDPRTRQSYLAAEETNHPNRLPDALRIVTDRNYCVQCHLVGDFVPEGSIRAQAPQLARVHQRLRPDWLRDWIANPKRLLPYTGMPVNFPLGKPASQELFKGDSLQQIDAVVDLLLNFDTFTKGQVTIKDKVPPPAAAAPESQPAAGGGD